MEDSSTFSGSEHETLQVWSVDLGRRYGEASPSAQPVFEREGKTEQKKRAGEKRQKCLFSRVKQKHKPWEGVSYAKQPLGRRERRKGHKTERA